MKKLLFIFFLYIFSYSGQVSAQDFYDISTIQKIEMSFSQSNWDYMLDTAKNGSDNYIMAQWVRVNGVQIDSVGVKYKGNSSYDSSNVKNPLHIELNAFVQGQDYQGYSDIKLNNGWLEPSMVRDVLGNKILKNYMQCPKANYAQVYINGTYYGLYSNVEAVNKDFVDNYFYSSGNPFFKCNPLIYQLQYFPTLEYLGADSTSYYNNYQMKSDFGWQSLINLCDTLTNYSSDIHKILDADRALWMLAFNNVLVNLDSYTGVASQNYYLCMDNTKRFNTIIWDVNMCFGSFNVLSPGPSGQLTITEMQQLSPVIQSTNSERPLIQKLLADSMYKRMYIAHMSTILNENFANSTYITEAQNLMSIIDTAFQSDPNTF
ncbi:MAG: CotH kinase family protein, partial [Bacteroidota bacterium]